ncbi:MAG: hypothetical protein BWK80_42340, partial [Desulfobacteraceae bacterium IS3]
MQYCHSERSCENLTLKCSDSRKSKSQRRTCFQPGPQRIFFRMKGRRFITNCLNIRQIVRKLFGFTHIFQFPGYSNFTVSPTG